MYTVRVSHYSGIFRTDSERGKAVFGLYPVLASNFVAMREVLEPRTRFGDDNHLYIEEMAEALD